MISRSVLIRRRIKAERAIAVFATKPHPHISQSALQTAAEKLARS